MITTRFLQRAAFLVFVMTSLAACGQTTISGCIRASNARGEQERASGAVVMLVPASNEFEADWQAALHAFREDNDSARRAYEHALASYRGAQVMERPTFVPQRQALKSSGLERYTVTQDAESGARMWSNQQPPPGTWIAASGTADASRAVVEAERRLHMVRDAHLGSAVALLKKHAAATATADLAGCYKITDVPAERTYVFVNYGERYWIREVVLRRGPMRADFSSAIAEWPLTDHRRSG